VRDRVASGIEPDRRPAADPVHGVVDLLMRLRRDEEAEVLIEQAGFSDVRLERYRLRSVF
jgi:hypothetical protein